MIKKNTLDLSAYEIGYLYAFTEPDMNFVNTMPATLHHVTGMVMADVYHQLTPKIICLIADKSKKRAKVSLRYTEWRTLYDLLVEEEGLNDPQKLLLGKIFKLLVDQYHFTPKYIHS